MNYNSNALSKVNSVKSSFFSLIRLCGNVVYRIEKSYMDKLVAWNPLNFSLLSISTDFLLTKTSFFKLPTPSLTIV